MSDALVGRGDGQVLFFRNAGHRQTAPAFAAFGDQPVRSDGGAVPSARPRSPTSMPTAISMRFIAAGPSQDVSFFRNDAVPQCACSRGGAGVGVRSPMSGCRRDPGAGGHPTRTATLDVFVGNLLGDLVFFRATP
jgi:hypothetical protein